MDTLGDIPLEDVFERFDDALAFLRARTPMPAEQFYALDDQARQKAFTVSNVGQMDMVQQVLDSLDKALETGQDLKAWQDEIGPALRKAWAGTVGKPAWRLETIYRTNVQTAFSHGRVRQMRDPAVTALRPFFLFDAILDGRTTDECSARDGVLLLAEDPWWLENTPPLHFNCRSGIRSLRKSQAERRGGVNPPDREVELNPPGKGFGAAPSLSPSVQVQPFVPEVTGHPALEGARLRKEAEEAARRASGTKHKPEHDPEHWVAEFQAKGYPEEVAKRLAHGKAAEERGLDRRLAELHAVAKRLEGAGIPAGKGIREVLDWLVEDGEVETLRAQLAVLAESGAPEHAEPRIRAMAALLEHASAIPPRQSPIKLPGRPRDDPKRRAEYQAAVGFYGSLSHPDLAHPTNYTIRWGARRGGHLPKARRINLSSRPGVLVHEWAHALEWLNQKTGRRSIEFLEKRIAGLPVLRSPGEGYGRGEYGVPDDFPKPYIGRIYREAGRIVATELLSMGLDMIAHGEGWRLQQEDADLFWFCLGQLGSP